MRDFSSKIVKKLNHKLGTCTAYTYTDSRKYLETYRKFLWIYHERYVVTYHTITFVKFETNMKFISTLSKMKVDNENLDIYGMQEEYKYI